jgi:hypothetical protein
MQRQTDTPSERLQRRESMKSVIAFLLGMWEFRSDLTTNPGDDLIEVYDLGREWAHRITFRRFESY